MAFLPFLPPSSLKSLLQANRHLEKNENFLVRVSYSAAPEMLRPHLPSSGGSLCSLCSFWRAALLTY